METPPQGGHGRQEPLGECADGGAAHPERRERQVAIERGCVARDRAAASRLADLDGVPGESALAHARLAHERQDPALRQQRRQHGDLPIAPHESGRSARQGRGEGHNVTRPVPPPSPGRQR
jgi:hypothetical protein